MVKNVLKGTSVILGVMFIVGCSSTAKDIEVRRYIDVRERVDQGMEQGNAGFITGTPQPEDRANIRKTRKIYVVEVSKDSDIDAESVVVEDAGGGESFSGDSAEAMDSDSQEYMITPKDSRRAVDDNMAETDVYNSTPKAPSPASMVEYTIQKDDTMQKISKKFYDSFSKWPRIYDANKDVIDNPDKIKPGTVIRIPMN